MQVVSVTGGRTKMLSADILILKISKRKERKEKSISVYVLVNLLFKKYFCQFYIKESLLNPPPKLSAICFQT